MLLAQTLEQARTAHLPYVAAANVSSSGAGYHYVGEASNAGLRPGQWPSTLETDLGNGRRLVRERPVRDSAGELIAVEYRQEFGCVVVKLFND